MTTELLLLDVFFANGTLSKYQVFDATSAPSAPSFVAASKKAPVDMSKASITTPKAVSTPTIKALDRVVTLPEKVIPIDLADEDATSSDGGISKAANTTNETVLSILDDSSDDDDDVVAPRKRLKTGRSTVVVLDDDEPQSSQGGVESIDEDDVYMLKEPKKPSPFGWMNQFNRENQEKSNGWVMSKKAVKASTDDWMQRKMQRPVKKPAQSKATIARNARNANREVVLSDDDDQSDGVDDSDDGDSYGKRRNTKRSKQDEVAGMLQSCEAIASTLRVSISKWGQSNTDEQVTLTTINDADHRMLTQGEIPGLSPSLVLQPYQLVGVNWLYLLYQHKVSAVLADEMGLGKTVQTISFLAIVCSQMKQPHLVIVPSSVLSNWKREIGRFAPSLRVRTFHGSISERQDLMDELQPGTFDILLTTYTYFERDSAADDRKFLRSFNYGYLVLDEGHTIKNANTSRFKRISALKTRNRLVLSGTPIQNNLSELLALLSFLMPTIFNHGSDELMDFFGGEEKTSCSKIRRILAPFILRRLKKLVLAQMVPKTEVVLHVKMNPHQVAVYKNVIDATLLRREAKKGGGAPASSSPSSESNGSTTKPSRELKLLMGGQAQSTVVVGKGKNDPTSDNNVFTLLRKAANHPVLLRQHYESPQVMDTIARQLYKLGEFGTECSLAMVKSEIEGYSDFELHNLCVEYAHQPEMRSLQLTSDKLLDSGKFDLLRELLPRLKREHHRVLIFSQWTKMLDLLETFLVHSNHRYTRLDGSTSIESRQSLIDDFNDDPSIFCFLLSTRAGGMGINLTAADTVILHDLDFNPTVDAQAMDRCHRIGQTKPVTVYKLVTEDSVDKSIYDIACRKTQLNDTVLGNLGKKSRDTQAAVDIQAILTTVLSSYQPTPTTNE
ncbi:hypothetical protein DYB26_003199 [Aphanomyces astaci]|uniref:Uncharacterized protein n=2 Tax=Aphanomyces astaci TaxID=112090 RepID=A0A418EGV4_APHAT|nr:hypothetical protein DYB26_003199 [Aphanomyces astaci]